MPIHSLRQCDYFIYNLSEISSFDQFFRDFLGFFFADSEFSKKCICSALFVSERADSIITDSLRACIYIMKFDESSCLVRCDILQLGKVCLYLENSCFIFRNSSRSRHLLYFLIQADRSSSITRSSFAYGCSCWRVSSGFFRCTEIGSCFTEVLFLCLKRVSYFFECPFLIF